MRQSLFRQIKKILPLVAMPLILLLGFNMLTTPPTKPRVTVAGERAVWDLRGFDFETANADFFGYVEFIPNALLTPDEFAAREDEAVLGNTYGESFVTGRMRILVPDSAGWFTFTRRSVEYSHRLYVNGEWVLDIGRPGYDRRTDIPATGRVTFTTQAVDGVIEIVQQSSNFVHRMGGAHQYWTVGSGTALIYEARADEARSTFLVGSYFVLSILFVLIYFICNKNRLSLFFALFCFIWFLRMGVTDSGIFTVFMPFLSWQMMFRIEYISVPALAMVSTLVYNLMFPGALNKYVVRVIHIFMGVFVLIFLFADTVLMSRLLIVQSFGTVLAVTYGFVQTLRLRKIDVGQRIFVAGFLLFFVATLLDITYRVGIFGRFPFMHHGASMLVFAVCAGIAVFYATMKEMEQIKESERQLAAEKSALEKLTRMKTEFMANISHEMKTPLYVMGGYAQLAEWKLDTLEKSAVGEEAITSLRTISQESRRLSQLVDRLLKVAGKDDQNTYAKISEIINRTAALCAPILEKNNNRLDVQAEKGCPSVAANLDVILQILVNLVGNADRHVRGGIIEIGIRRDGDMVLFHVSDNGEGIPAELLGNIFDRGISGDGSTGLGLHICKEAVEAHGGTIEIESAPGSGTCVNFTLPINKDDEGSADI